MKDGPVLPDPTFGNVKESSKSRPNWWLCAFYTAISFYLAWWIINVNTDLMKSPAEKNDSAMAKRDTQNQAKLTAQLDQLDDKTLIEWSQNSNIVDEGEAIYKVYCIACHGADLKGGIGRSLMDDTWAHGGHPTDLLNLTLNGTPKNSPGFKGQKMQVWKDIIGTENVAKAVSFIISKSPGVKK